MLKHFYCDFYCCKSCLLFSPQQYSTVIICAFFKITVILLSASNFESYLLHQSKRKQWTLRQGAK